MSLSFTHIQARLALVTTLSLALSPVFSYCVAAMFGMVEFKELLNPLSAIPLASVYTLVVCWGYWYSSRFVDPLKQWSAEHKYGQEMPEPLKLHLKNFTSNYWTFFLLIALSLPTVQHWTAAHTFTQASHGLVEFMLLNLVVAIYAGTPGYLYTLNLLGHINRHLGCSTVNVNIRTRMLLIGAYLPILTVAILLKYYWWQTGFLANELLIAFGLISALLILITLVATNNLTQALAPVKRVISSGGATSYNKMARLLRPQSMDEIGYLVQMLGNVFKRLVEQESHVSAIVDHAAEGIIVLDEELKIDTFNPAAERLFGYRRQEIRGKPLAWLIPQLDISSLNIEQVDEEHEVIARHKNGRSIPTRARVSQMQRGDSTFYSLIVADISEKKAAEDKLLEAEARYRNLVETAHDLVWSVDTEGRWVYLNNAVQNIYGYSVNEMLNRPFTEFQAEESGERDLEAFRTVLKGKELIQYETIHLDRHGNRKYISFNARPQYDNKGNLFLVSGTARDITERKEFEKELTYQAQHDNLTGLYNRNYFQSELERVISRIARSGAECCLLYLDLDQFKYVNDTLGHGAGDRLLKECTDLLRKNIREGDLLARFGGDEFTIILYNIDHDHAIPVAENIRTMFEHYRFNDSGQTINVTCSIGLTMIDNQTSSADEAMSRADLACNISKNHGRNCVHEYAAEDDEQSIMAEDMGWVARVRDAIENDQFKMIYQPIVAIDSHTIHGYEVLLRLPTEDGQQIKPGGFLPAAERFGLMHSLDRWTVRHSMEYLAQLHEDDFQTQFSINLSGRSIEDAELLRMVQSILKSTGLNPASLTFEITETSAIANMNAARRFIGNLKDLGCRMSLDDFGAGFCSFTYLKHLPVDSLKIDGSFVQGLTNTEVDRAMVKSMNQIAHALGKSTIAEFVENHQTLDMLKELGVDYAQGHFLGRPRSNLLVSLESDHVSDAPLLA